MNTWVVDVVGLAERLSSRTRWVLLTSTLGALTVGVATFVPIDTDNGTRLYLLSTIAQTVGALFGITVSLILVVVQLRAQHHSTVAFLAANRTTYGFLTLNSLTICVSIVYMANGSYFVVGSETVARLDEAFVLTLGLSSLISSPLFLLDALRTLSPKETALRIAGSITISAIALHNEILLGASRRHPPGSEEDPVTMYTDMVRSALRDHHVETANLVMRILTSRIAWLLKKPPEALEPNAVSYLLLTHLCKHLRRMIADISAADAAALIFPLRRVIHALPPRPGRKTDPSGRAPLLEFIRELPSHFNEQTVRLLLDYAFRGLCIGDQLAPVEALNLLDEKQLLQHSALRLSLMISLNEYKGKTRSRYDELLQMIQNKTQCCISTTQDGLVP